jgi:uncharacterized protein with PIN domain
VNRSDRLTFSLDSSLGRLARWLRLLGYDAASDPGWTLRQALSRARSEGRVLLTRSRDLHRLGLSPPAAGDLLVLSDRVEDQLVEVGRRWPIFQRSELFSRCSECNEPLDLADTGSARQKVPPYVAKTQNRFKVCPRCGKIYWSATHTDQMTRFFRRLAERAMQSESEDPWKRGAGSVSADPTPREVRPEGNPSP